MGSIGSPNSWAPYDTYKDCSQGICSVYCPQWCYIIFPPPPPFMPDDDSGTNFSPLIIAVIGILASAFLLIAYYTVISKYCRRRGGDDNPITGSPFEANQSQLNHDQWQVAPTGLDQAIIESITFFKYKKGDGLIEGTECAVCLSEFLEDECLRLLPKCDHAFHIHCIDTWLKSHSNCPLCRASVVVVSSSSSSSSAHHPLPNSSLNISSLEVNGRNDVTLVVDDREWVGHTEEIVVSVASSDFIPKIENSHSQEELRRSFSLGSFPSKSRLLVSDILHISEVAEDMEMETEREICRLSNGVGSSQGENSVADGGNEVAEMKRSVSTGRFSFKGKKSVFLN